MHSRSLAAKCCPIFCVTFDNLQRTGFSFLYCSFAPVKKWTVPFTETSTGNVSIKIGISTVSEVGLGNSIPLCYSHVLHTFKIFSGVIVRLIWALAISFVERKPDNFEHILSIFTTLLNGNQEQITAPRLLYWSTNNSKSDEEFYSSCWMFLTSSTSVSCCLIHGSWFLY